MRTRWTSIALSQLEALQDYIAEDDPLAACEVATKILDRVELDLTANPSMRRPGEHVPGTRELVIVGTPYIVVYRIADDVIQVLRVRHGAQLWPRANN